MSQPSMHDRNGWIWLDGRLVPWREANLHVLTHGLHYASSVFEGNRAYAGRVFKLREHSERLIASGRIMGFEIPFSAEQLDRACEEVIAANGIVDGYVRPIAWRGSEQLGVSAQATTIHVAVATWQWPSYWSPELRERGIRLAHALYRRPDPATAPTKAKAAGLYMICTISKHEAEAQGYHDALMLDWRGQLAEATGANLFLVIEGRLHTPTPDCFLDGITRRTVMDLARARGIEIVERALWPEDLKRASEVFLTGTAAEVTGVGQIGEDLHYQVGPVTRMLRDAYAAEVRAHAAERAA